MPHIVVNHNHPKHKQDYHEYDHKGCGLEMRPTFLDRIERLIANGVGGDSCCQAEKLHEETGTFESGESFGSELRRMVYEAGDMVREIFKMERTTSSDTFEPSNSGG